MRAAAVAAVAWSLTAAQAQPVFFDNFDGYDTDLQLSSPGAWGDAQDLNQPPAGYLGIGGNPGQCLEHPGGESNRHVIPPTFASDARPIVWEFDVIAPLGNNPFRRLTGGLRVGSATAILEMGYYNLNDWPEQGGIDVSGYGVRTVFIGGPAASNGWICFPTNPAVGVGKHRFRATIRSSSITFDLDLDADGVIDDTRHVQTNDLTALGWDTLRIGGPSDLSSSGDPIKFDNVSIRIDQPACPADLDANGTLNFDDIDAFITAFLAADLLADIDANGTLNFDDIDAFVASFLAGCP